MKGEVPAAVHMPVRMRACVNTCMCNTYMWICGGGGAQNQERMGVSVPGVCSLHLRLRN